MKFDVSIRAPPTRAGRLRPCRHGAHSTQFQSAPRPRGRGDGVDARGIVDEIVVSIRAPPTRAGRLHPGGFWREAAAFQSAPRPRGRGDP